MIITACNLFYLEIEFVKHKDYNINLSYMAHMKIFIDKLYQ